MRDGKSWVAPAMGVVFIALLIAGFILINAFGDSLNATKKSATEIVDYYTAHKDRQMTGAFLLGGAAVAFLFFNGAIRRVLRDAEGPGHTLSAVAFSGGIVFAAAGGIGATFHFAAADLADNLDPIAVQAINGLDYDYFIPFAIGMSTFLLATGISAVRHGALPKWLAWSAIVIGIADYTPAGFFGFLLSLVWILVVSVMLALRARRGAAPAAPAATTPA